MTFFSLRNLIVIFGFFISFLYFFWGNITLIFAEGVRPNIVLILSDDMGYSDIGYYGSEIATPNLDHLAENGICFTQFYNTAKCCPSRASLLTGLHPHQAGLASTLEDRKLPGHRGDLLPSCVTIAEVLHSAGYSTYCAGKWHLTKSIRNKINLPTQRGFDRYYGIIGGATSYFEPATLFRDETPISPFADMEYKPEGEYYLTHAISDHAVQFLEDHHKNSPNKPFFMYVAYTAAHWPLHALPDDIVKYKGKYDNGYSSIRQHRYEKLKQQGIISEHWKLSPQAEHWDTVENKAWESACMEVYAAIVDSMDQGIGHIIETLKKTEQYNNTVIFFLHDNGGSAEADGRKPRTDYPNRVDQPVYEPYPPQKIIQGREDNLRTRGGFPVIHGSNVMPGPKDTFIAYGRGWANVSNTPFREYKLFVHEGGIATPLIIHAPNLIDRSLRGKLYREYGQIIDLMPTCVDLAGAEYPKKRNGIEVTPMQGMSLTPVFSGKTLGRTTPLFWEYGGCRAVRNGKWKLVTHGVLAQWELYNMDVDRSELNNLAKEYPEIVAKMSEQWTEWAKRSNVFPSPWKMRQN